MTSHRLYTKEVYSVDRIIREEAEEIVKFLKKEGILPDDYLLPEIIVERRLLTLILEKLPEVLGLSIAQVGIISRYLSSPNDSTPLIFVTPLFLLLLYFLLEKRSKFDGLYVSNDKIIISLHNAEELGNRYLKLTEKCVGKEEKLRIGVGIILSHEICHEDKLVGSEEEKAFACERLVLSYKLPLEEIVNFTKREVKEYLHSQIMYKLGRKLKLPLLYTFVFDYNYPYVAGLLYFLEVVEKERNASKRWNRMLERLKNASVEEIYKTTERRLKMEEW